MEAETIVATSIPNRAAAVLHEAARKCRISFKTLCGYALIAAAKAVDDEYGRDARDLCEAMDRVKVSAHGRRQLHKHGPRPATAEAPGPLFTHPPERRPV